MTILQSDEPPTLGNELNANLNVCAVVGNSESWIDCNVAVEQM